MESSSKPRRVGIIGGSFDPVHLGHLMIARDAAEHLDLSEIMFMPAACPPHKRNIRQVEATHRLNMLRLAVGMDERFYASDLEIRRGGVSYTVDTVAELRAAQPDTDWFLIIGSDTLVELHTWHRVDELLEMCTVATLLRPGIDSAELIRQRIELQEESREKLMAHVISAHQMNISSTEIRQRISAGEPIDKLVPEAVAAYILEHGLYRQ